MCTSPVFEKTAVIIAGRFRRLLSTLSHLSRAGQAHMVDVGSKEPAVRKATAQATIRISNKGVFDALIGGALSKGDAFAVARIAGIQGAKQTSALIPLCHPALPLDWINVELQPDIQKLAVRVLVEVSVTARTGVEMEALTGATAAALALYDMCKAGFKSSPDPIGNVLYIENVMILAKEKQAPTSYVSKSTLSERIEIGAAQSDPHAIQNPH